MADCHTMFLCTSFILQFIVLFLGNQWEYSEKSESSFRFRIIILTFYMYLFLIYTSFWINHLAEIQKYAVFSTCFLLLVNYMITDEALLTKTVQYTPFIFLYVFTILKDFFFYIWFGSQEESIFLYVIFNL